MKKSKFYKPEPFIDRLIFSIKGFLFWKGRKKGMIHTIDITLDDIRAIFFPKSFYEKYKYLGSVPWNEEGGIFKAMEPLVIFMDHKAKPWWCPRWFLRFLHLFGDDNSIVRVRNRRLSNLKRKLTKGLGIIDYKTKWSHYDLRISISGTDQMWDLADAIEHKFYDKECRKDLSDQIKKLDPNTKYHEGYTIDMLQKELDRLDNLNSK
jgi:hypothetical protein